MSRKLIGMIMAIIVSLFFIGCPMNYTGATDTDGDGVPDSRDEDIDGDGLSNDNETSWGTNPYLEDTDGDGWDDGEEAIFNDDFSPILANLPILQLIITSTPQITLTGENTSSESQAFTISEGRTIETSQTTASSLSETTSLENSWSLEATLGYEVSVGINAGETISASLTAGYGGSYTSEHGYSWSQEETRSNTNSVEESETYASEQSVTYDGGVLSVTAKLKNPSAVSYKLEDLLVSGYKLNTLDGNFGTYSPIGNGNMTISNFSDGEITLGPGAETGDFTLTQTFDSPEYVKNLARYCPSMIFSVSGYSSSMSVGGITSDFTEEMTKVSALCSKVIIDYGEGMEPDQYMVAARTKPNPDPTSLDDVYLTLTLREILQNMGMAAGTDYLEDPESGAIIEINEVEENPTAHAQWLISVKDLEDDYTYYPASEGFDLDAIPIEAGYVVNICYSQDQDGDGLVLAMETYYGSSDTDTDSDDDGILDKDEVLGWNLTDGTTVYTHPALTDTDGDGIDDKEDEDPVSYFTHSTANITGITITDKADTDTVFVEESTVYTGESIIDEYAMIQVQVEEPVRTVKIDNVSMARDPVDNTLYTLEIQTLDLGSTDFQIEVTSEDLGTTSTSTLRIDSLLGDLPNLVTIDELLNSSGEKYQIDVGFNWGSTYDSRAIGALLLFISGEDPPTDFHVPDSLLLPKTLKQDENPTVYDSGETAVFYWDSSGGTAELGTDAGSFFNASYYNKQYSYRLITVGQKTDGTYTYSQGMTTAEYTTPYPDTFMIDDLYLRFQWDSIENDESDPEFIINTNLVEPSDQGSDYLADITTKTDNSPWKPAITGDLNDHNDSSEIGYSLLFDIPDSNRDDSLFGIWSDIDEDETAGEHDCVNDTNYFQFLGPDGDGLYRINENSKYSGTTTVHESYHDSDKGDITIYYTFDYHSVGTE